MKALFLAFALGCGTAEAADGGSTPTSERQQAVGRTPTVPSALRASRQAPASDLAATAPPNGNGLSLSLDWTAPEGNAGSFVLFRSGPKGPTIAKALLTVDIR